MERRRFATTQGGVSRGDRVDYGQRPPGSMTRQEQWDRREEDYGMSPWYARGGEQMPWSGPPGQERGQRAPIYTPDPADPRNAGYWRNQSTPEEAAADEAAARGRYAQQQELLAGNDAYQAAKASGDLRGQIAAMTALKQQMQQDRFVAQGGTPETWQNRYRNENDWPRPGVGGAVPAPGPRPAGVGPSMPPARTAGGAPPMQNPMMQGYLGGGAGVSQGPGGFGGYGPRNDYMYRGPMPGGYNPGQSKSGMGQNPAYSPGMTTGSDFLNGPMGGMRNMGDYLPSSALAPWMRQFMPGYNMGGGGLGAWLGGLGGGGGFGYNPGAQFSPWTRAPFGAGPGMFY